MPLLKDVGVDDGLGGHQVVMLQDRDPLDAAGGRQGHAGQPPAVWPAVPARRLWALRSARCRVTEGPAARCESTRSRWMRARMCARRLTRPSSMTMRSASARASGFLLWSFPRRARAAALPTSRLARPRCSGHPSQPAAPAAVTRRRAVAPGRCVGQPDVSGGWPGRLVCRRDTPRPGRRCPRPQARWTCLPGAGPTRTRTDRRSARNRARPPRVACDRL